MLANFDSIDTHGTACNCSSCAPGASLTSALHASGCDCLACENKQNQNQKQNQKQVQVQVAAQQRQAVQTTLHETHGVTCACSNCRQTLARLYGPAPAMAYETKDEDGIKRSPDYYAQIIQVCI